MCPTEAEDTRPRKSVETLRLKAEDFLTSEQKHRKIQERQGKKTGGAAFDRLHMSHIFKPETATASKEDELSFTGARKRRISVDQLPTVQKSKWETDFKKETIAPVGSITGKRTISIDHLPSVIKARGANYCLKIE